MELAESRRTIHLYMHSTRPSSATRALARGSSLFSLDADERDRYRCLRLGFAVRIVRPAWVMILLTIASLLSTSAGPASSATEDFYRYDLGGTIEISSRKELARVRSFLWKHWIEHKRGIIVTVVHSVDAGDSTMSYFIEPDAPGGDWRIVIEVRRNPHTEPDQITTRSVISNVKRIEPVHNGWDDPVEIPNGAVRPVESYMLCLKTQDGKVFVNL
jgi:hypothetical protein